MTLSKEYCTVCGKDVDVTETTEASVIFVKSTPVNITAKVLKCKECGAYIYTPELDSYNTNIAYNEFMRICNK